MQEIQPYETKALMRVSFVGRVASNHTAFIRIKASQPAPNQELLILPVEVEVTAGNKELYNKNTNVFLVLLKLSLCKLWRLSNPACNGVMKCNIFIKVFLFHFTAPGLFSSTDMLDFGTLRTMGKLDSIYYIQIHAF